jgi:hypothetical protein
VAFDPEVVVAPPRTDEQFEVFEEAMEVIGRVDANVNDLGTVKSVGVRAAELVGSAAT